MIIEQTKLNPNLYFFSKEGGGGVIGYLPSPNFLHPQILQVQMDALKYAIKVYIIDGALKNLQHR